MYKSHLGVWEVFILLNEDEKSVQNLHFLLADGKLLIDKASVSVHGSETLKKCVFNPLKAALW